MLVADDDDNVWVPFFYSLCLFHVADYSPVNNTKLKTEGSKDLCPTLMRFFQNEAEGIKVLLPK